MDAALQTNLRDQLMVRRQKLDEAVGEIGRADDLVRLLHEVDSALKRLDGGTFGRCEVCELSVDDSFLAANPLIQFCLCDLNEAQQNALQRDLDLASRIQWALLPRPGLEQAGWHVEFRYQPAGPVSGDYLDVVSKNGEGIYFLLGDVSGKGVAASFLMARLNALFRSLIDLNLPLKEIVQRANRLFSEGTIASHYATLVCGRATPDGRIEICNAGHCPPLLLSKG